MKKLFKKHRLSGLLLLLLAVILFLLCLTMDSLELTYGLRTDFSFNKVTTTSATTNEILAEIHTPVHIYAIYQDQTDPQLIELLKRYQALNPLVTYEVTNITMNPGLAARFKGDAENTLTQDCLVVFCAETERYRILKYTDLMSANYSVALEDYIYGLNYEKALTEAMIYVTRDTIPEIAILQGHGELDVGVADYLCDFLVSNHYDVRFVNLLAGDTLEGTSLLFLLSPYKDLSKNEIESLLTYLNGGGSLFITCDADDPVESMPNYLSLLRLYGFTPLDGVAVAAADEPNTYYDAFPYVLLPTMQPTLPTNALIAGYQNTLLLQWARAFETPVQADNSLTVQPVLFSSYNTYLIDIYRDSLDQQDSDPTGPFAMALLAERMMTSTEISRAFIIGCSTMLTDANQYAITDSGVFILRMVQHLLGQEGISLAIEQKPAVPPGLSATSQTLGIALIVLAPLLVLATALIVLLPKRNR